MRSLGAFSIIRELMWRLGRKMYTCARGDGQNDPRTNGEYWLLEKVLKESSGPQMLFDVGANKGNWTAEALRLSNASSDLHVHAFEPSPATRALLTARFAANPAVTVSPYAVSDIEGVGTFYSNENGAGTNSLASISGPNEEVVTITTIDRFLQRSEIENIAMVKVDAEGFDLMVLRGAADSLRDGRIEIVQFEYNWRWLLNHACLRDVFEIISGKPYLLGKLVGNTVEFYEQWHFELDRYFENNYVLIRKGSKIVKLGSWVQFSQANVGVRTYRKSR